MAREAHLPFPVLDALPLGAHRLVALTDQPLFEAIGVRVLFTGRSGGVSDGCYASLNMGGHVGDDPAAVLRNRRIVCEAAGADSAAIAVLNQVHGTDFMTISDAQQVEGGATSLLGIAVADGMVVEAADVAAMLFSADCLLFAVVSPSGRFALAHAGWRGAIAGIAGKAVRLLAEGDAYAPADFNAYIGPHICQKCFEVGDDVRQRFVEHYSDAVVDANGNVSLADSVTADLVAAGVNVRRIVDAHACTKCNSDQYFSYRATNGECGRQAAFAWRAGD